MDEAGLAVILDLFSRREVGWAMSENIDRHMVLNALDMALKGRQPARGLLHHSDRGSQYASEDYQKVLAARGIQCSMSRKGTLPEPASVPAPSAGAPTVQPSVNAQSSGP